MCITQKYIGDSAVFDALLCTLWRLKPRHAHGRRYQVLGNAARLSGDFSEEGLMLLEEFLSVCTPIRL